MPFDYKDLPDLAGKCFIITGSTSGLGKVQALNLAKHNAHVIVVGRSEQKVQDTVEWIKAETKNQTVEGMIADLMDLNSVAKFCDSFLSKDIPLYSLTLNAATLNQNMELSKDGIESQWQTNVLSQYFICMKLLPALKKSAEARIVILSSTMHSQCKSRFPLTTEYINDAAAYSNLKRYGETKTANVLFTRYLSQHLKEFAHENVFVNSLHPGIIATNILSNIWAPIRVISNFFSSNPDTGAKTQTYLSASPEVALKKYQGEYFIPNAQISQASKLATDDVYGQELVQFLESQLKSVFNK